jgi:hypothetical protein
MTAPFVAHGFTLALAWFLIVNIVTSVSAACAVRWLSARERRSAFWLLLRLSPAVVSTVFVAGLFVPSYWQYEPADTAEGFDVTLTACAGAAIVLVLIAVIRGGAAWLRSRRRAQTWLRRARRSGIVSGVPVFEVDAEVPLMALVGIIRPRLFVTGPLVAALSPEEIQVSIAHEIAHRTTGDNLKRLLMCLAPDVLGMTTAARAIERRWALAAEHAADNRAGGADPRTRCTLASALVKVARLMPSSGAPPTLEPISTLVDSGDITTRVERLLDDRRVEENGLRRTPRLVVTFAVSAAILAGYSSSLVTVHEATETLVQLLP